MANARSRRAWPGAVRGNVHEPLGYRVHAGLSTVGVQWDLQTSATDGREVPCFMSLQICLPTEVTLMKPGQQMLVISCYAYYGLFVFYNSWFPHAKLFLF